MVLLKEAGASKDELIGVYKKHEKESTSRSGENNCKSRIQDFIKLLQYAKELYKAVGNTYTKLRPGRRRCYLWLSSILYFLFLMAELGLLHGPILGKLMLNFKI